MNVKPTTKGNKLAVLIYNLEEAKPELSDFKLEKLNKDNPLIIHKENQLLYSK
jgi:hypothetical protein